MFRSIAPLLVLSLATLSLSTSAHAASGWIDCYEDIDEDGYAADTSTIIDTVWAPTVSGGFPATHAVDACPAGSAPRAGDCDDTNPTTHPFGGEWSDGLDDDCDGLVDEPTFAWQTFNPSIHSDTEVVVTYSINDAQTHSILDNGGTVRIAVDYRAVTGNHSGSLLTMVQADSTSTSDTFTLPSLLPGTVYEVEIAAVEFYSPIFSTWFDIYDVGGTPLESETFYTMTTGGSAGDDRAEAVLLAFFHYGIFNNWGLSGYAGWYRDGMFYGAQATEAWCSEFYDSMVEQVFGDPHAANIFDLENWFRTTSGAQYLSVEDGLSEDPTLKIKFTYPGEWLWWDQGGDTWSQKKSRGHTVMVLGYDAGTDRVTYLSGNDGNRIAVRTMASSDPRIAGGGIGWLP